MARLWLLRLISYSLITDKILVGFSSKKNYFIYVLDINKCRYILSTNSVKKNNIRNPIIDNE